MDAINNVLNSPNWSIQSNNQVSNAQTDSITTAFSSAFQANTYNNQIDAE
jgi:hypothetical protein